MRPAGVVSRQLLTDNAPMDTNWTMRTVLEGDADTIARHNQYREVDAGKRPGYAAWVEPRIRQGAYVGRLAVVAGTVVAGAGAVLLDWGPTRANPCGQMARVVNVFTAEGWRRRGIARALLEAVLKDCEVRGIREFNLAASPDGQSLYAALGFKPYPAEMRRRVEAT